MGTRARSSNVNTIGSLPYSMLPSKMYVVWYVRNIITLKAQVCGTRLQRVCQPALRHTRGRRRQISCRLFINGQISPQTRRK